MKNFIVYAMTMALSAVGCASSTSVEKEPLSSGPTRFFSAGYDATLSATRKAIPDVGLKLDSEKNVDNGSELIAERGMTAWSWGEVVRVLVQPMSSGTSVRVFSDKALKLNVTAKDFSDDLFTRIGQRLGEYP